MAARKVVPDVEVAGDSSPATPATVTVLAPYQVVHADVVYTPGQPATIPEEVAALWRERGWVK